MLTILHFAIELIFSNGSILAYWQNAIEAAFRGIGGYVDVLPNMAQRLVQ